MSTRLAKGNAPGHHRTHNHYGYLQDVSGWLPVIRLASFYSLARHPLGSGVLSRVCASTLAVRMRFMEGVVCFTGVCTKHFLWKLHMCNRYAYKLIKVLLIIALL